MYWMVCGIRFFLWFLLLMSTSSFCSGSELDVRCLKSLQRSVIDSRGVLESSWNFSSFICFFTGVECWNESGEEVRVLSLRLSNMGLEGQFPQGSIPSDIARQLPDLPDNIFSGEIPPGISNMTYLNVLTFSTTNSAVKFQETSMSFFG